MRVCDICIYVGLWAQAFIVVLGWSFLLSIFIIYFPHYQNNSCCIPHCSTGTETDGYVFLFYHRLLSVTLYFIMDQNSDCDGMTSQNFLKSKSRGASAPPPLQMPACAHAFQSYYVWALRKTMRSVTLMFTNFNWSFKVNRFITYWSTRWGHAANWFRDSAAAAAARIQKHRVSSFELSFELLDFFQVSRLSTRCNDVPLGIRLRLGLGLGLGLHFNA